MLRAVAMCLILGNLAIYALITWNLLNWLDPVAMSTRQPISVVTDPVWRPMPCWI